MRANKLLSGETALIPIKELTPKITLLFVTKTALELTGGTATHLTP